ncbi:hypothetical protein ACOSQ2_030161 [Xanthoceras sorbifolium]
MKRLDIFCASQASTAICLSMDQPSSSSASSSSIMQLGGRAIDRHNPIIRDGRRFTAAPCSSQIPPINPVPYHQLQKTKKISSSNNNNNKPTTDHQTKKKDKQQKKKKKKSSSSSKPNDVTNKKTTTSDAIYKNISSSVPAAVDIKRKSCVKPGDLITPPGSSRYLLSDAAFFDGLSEYNDPVLALVPGEPMKITSSSPALLDQHESTTASKQPSSTPSEKPSSNQVVVLRVSLHCKGCAGKLRKHLSRMEGVTSFNIDFAAKKVTVVGDVTPLSVLASVSKVKNAQFWPVPVVAPPSTPPETTAVVPSNTNPEMKK